MHDFLQKPFKQKWYLYIYGVLSGILLIFSCYLTFSQHLDTKFDNEVCTKLNKDWSYIDTNGEQVKVNAPTMLPANEENICRISNILPQSADGQYFAKYCSFQSYKMYIDNVLFFDSSMGDVSVKQFRSSEGAYWSIVALPRWCSGRTITIEQTSTHTNYTGQVGNILIGSKSSILFAIIRMSWATLLTASICLLCGLIMSVVGFFMKEPRDKMRSILFLGWFQVWSAIWLFSESGCTQFLMSNAFLANLLSFVSSKMMLLTFVFYIESILEKKRKALFIILYSLVLTDITLSMLLQATGVMSFYDTVIVSHILIALSGILVIYSVCYDTFVNKNPVTRVLLLCILILIACAMIEVFNMYFGDLMFLGDYLIIGVGFFILVMGLTSVLDIKRNLALSRKTQYYENLAMKDSMTQCWNRTAYWLDMEHFRKYNDKTKNMAAVMCDINNLKGINDTYGHKAGDEAIILCAEVLQEIFNKYGKIYRIGGDEFIVMIDSLDRSIVDTLTAEFDRELALRAQEREYRLSAAIGVSAYNEQWDNALDDTIKRADELMYKNKRAQKAALKACDYSI